MRDFSSDRTFNSWTELVFKKETNFFGISGFNHQLNELLKKTYISKFFSYHTKCETIHL